jgi:hypothetical protein
MDDARNDLGGSMAEWQAAMQFLHQRQDLKATPEVGQIECIISDRPFTSVASQ